MECLSAGNRFGRAITRVIEVSFIRNGYWGLVSLSIICEFASVLQIATCTGKADCLLEAKLT
jgi:hypothetical protein